MLHIKNIINEMASFIVLKSSLSLYWIYRQCAVEFSVGKQQRLTIHYGLEWLAFVLCSCSRSSQEILPLQWSDADWERSLLLHRLLYPPAHFISGVFYFTAWHEVVGVFWHLHHQSMIFRQLFSKKKFWKIIISKIIKNFADLGKIH